MSRFVTYVGAGLFVCLSVLLATTGPVGGVVAIGMVVVVLAIVCLGPDKVGTGFLALTFLTAPFYKGLEGSVGSSVLVNVILAGAILLLLPRILQGRTHAAIPYTVGVSVIAVTGMLASAASVSPASSLVALAQWLVCIVVLPLIMVSLRLERVAVDRLAWMFVIGHMISIAYGLAVGPVGDGGRYDGLTQHPNAFAQSGLISFALLLHLLRTARRQWIVYGAMAASLASIYLSGSRGGTAAVACIIILIPVVERSAFVGYLLAFAGVVAFVTVQQVMNQDAAGGSLARLMGAGSSAGSDAARSQSLHDAIDRFQHHPLLGNGLLDLFLIHNNYAEVAVSVGSFGLLAFLVLLWSLGRGLFGRSELRRLCYPVAAYAVFGATIPSLTDRSIWLAITLSFAVFRGFAVPPDDPRQIETLRWQAELERHLSARSTAPVGPVRPVTRLGQPRSRSH